MPIHPLLHDKFGPAEDMWVVFSQHEKLDPSIGLLYNYITGTSLLIEDNEFAAALTKHYLENGAKKLTTEEFRRMRAELPHEKRARR